MLMKPSADITLLPNVCVQYTVHMIVFLVRPVSKMWVSRILRLMASFTCPLVMYVLLLTR